MYIGNRPLRIARPLNEAETFWREEGFTFRGHLLTQYSDPKRTITKIEYDANENPVAQKLGDGQTRCAWEYQYDEAGYIAALTAREFALADGKEAEVGRRTERYQQFKTLKYRPDFPGRFDSIFDARAFCQGFFNWYNREHHHSGIALLTPQDVHFSRAQAVITHRASVLDAAYAAHPERFVRKRPQPLALPQGAYINPPKPGSDTANVPQNQTDSVSNILTCSVKNRPFGKCLRQLNP